MTLYAYKFEIEFRGSADLVSTSQTEKNSRKKLGKTRFVAIGGLIP